MPENLIEKTRISFPRTVIPEEAEKILQHICEDLCCEVRYTHESIVRIAKPDAPYKNERHVKKVYGAFSNFTDCVTLIGFDLVREQKTGFFENFSGLHFNTPPGYDLDEIDPKEVRFMEETRQSIFKYFSR